MAIIFDLAVEFNLLPSSICLVHTFIVMIQFEFHMLNGMLYQNINYWTPSVANYESLELSNSFPLQPSF